MKINTFTGFNKLQLLMCSAFLASSLICMPCMSYAADDVVYSSKGSPTYDVSGGQQKPQVKKKTTSVGDPTFPPQKNEYYPISNKKFPKAITNPNAHTRDITFTGKPLDIFTKLDMVTQIVLPSTPALINIGKPEAFGVEAVPEFNAIFIKPLREVEMTNLIVTCENGSVYLFILKDNPYIPWDIRCQIKDPYSQVKADDPQSMIKMLYLGKRLPSFQGTPMDLRTPNASSYVYDPISKMGCRITLRRAIALPRIGKSAYWVEFENLVPGGLTAPAASYAINEQSVWTQKLTRVAVPGFRNGDPYPMLSKGDKIPVFMLVDMGQIPSVFKFRFALNGSRNLPVDVMLPTNHGVVKKQSATKSVDDKLREEYEQLVKSGKIKPMTEEEVKLLTEARNAEAQKQYEMQQAEQQKMQNQGTDAANPAQPQDGITGNAPSIVEFPNPLPAN